MRTPILLLTAFSALLASAQPITQWSRTAGGVSQYEKYLSATDATGHIYTAMPGQGTGMDLGNGITVTNPGPVIARYDSSGAISWARALTSTPNEYGQISAIATNSEGDLWATGYFTPTTLTLDDIVLTGNSSSTYAFLVRFDSTGAVEFATAWGPGTSATAIAADMCIDGLDNVYVTGYSDADILTVGDITLTNAFSELQLFALKFDASGTPVWGTISEAPMGAVGWSIATDAAGNAYVVCTTTGVFFIDEDFVYTGTINQAVLVKLNDFGGVVRMDVLAQCNPKDLAVDDAGNAYVCGYLDITANFNGDTLVPSVLDGFVAAYDIDGNYRWVVGVQGGIDNELCWSVDLDVAQTGLYVGGTFVFSAYFGGMLVEAGQSPTDGFVMQLDTAGTVSWVKVMTGDGPTMYAEACVDPWGHLYASGVTQSATIYLDEPVLNGSGNHAFLARFGDLSTTVPSVVRAGDTRPYPNPCDGAFTVALPADAHSVMITDALGREKERRSVRGVSTSFFQMDVPGVYSVSVLTETGREVQRVVVE